DPRRDGRDLRLPQLRRAAAQGVEDVPELRPPVRAGPARVTAAVAAALVISAARADDSPLDALIAKVKKGMAGVKTTRGRFKQTKKLAAFDDTVESKGTFAIERPGKLRW